ncbi:hypothetical protein N7535_001403 [Penicillium sp. DV-2018c]|nr:hypothetical protein N7535_001403 [Penicillium sp. DV-2018c]
MKFIIASVLAALLTTAAAQGLSDLPDCSKTCATGAIPKECGIDFKCICEAKSFLSDVTCCVADKCSKADQDLTIKVAKSICARGGVNDLPSEVVCSKSSSSTSSTSSGTSGGASTSTETTTKTTTGVTVETKTDGSTSTTVTGTHTSTMTNTNTLVASTSTVGATSTGLAPTAYKDSLVAAAGAAAAFAMLI